jgi:uncharacterized protein YjbI with pentapeptide repeats
MILRLREEHENRAIHVLPYIFRRKKDLRVTSSCTMRFHEQRNAQESALADLASLIYNGSTTSEENVMAIQEQLALLQQSIATWNTWRKEHQDIQPDFSEADLSYADLHSADLSYADLTHANLSYADLSWANLHDADLDDADLRDSESH